jgi:hypothetical protein
MNCLLSESVKFVTGIAPVANAFAGTAYTDIVSMANYEKALFLLQKGVGATGTATITLEACSDNTGAGATAIPFRYRRNNAAGSPIDAMGAFTNATASGFVTTAGSNDQYAIEVTNSELLEGKPWLRLKSVEGVVSAVAGSVLIILSGARYAGVELPSAV